MLSDLANKFRNGGPISIAASFIECPQIMDGFMWLPGWLLASPVVDNEENYQEHGDPRSSFSTKA